MNYIKKIVFLPIIIIIVSAVLFITNVHTQQKNIADNVLRLHITADSNSAYDQLIKLSVRDCILKNYGSIFSQCNTPDMAVNTARIYAGGIKKVVESELNKFNKSYPVSVTVQECSFPVKTYGSITLPAGNYTALNIDIGSGKGRNWWCVMYPPLCVSGNTVKADEETLGKLKKELSAEEYAFVTEKGELNIKTKFKLMEIIERFR